MSAGYDDDPSVESLEASLSHLTQRSILAVISRLARRALPLLPREGESNGYDWHRYYWPATGAVELAENLAAGGFVLGAELAEAEGALGLNSEAHLWSSWSTDVTRMHIPACAEHLAMAARRVAPDRWLDTKQSWDGKRHIRRAAAIAAVEGVIGTASHEEGIHPASYLKRDMAMLSVASKSAFWEEGQPVDPREGGPLGRLWPDGIPEWFHRGKRALALGRELVISRFMADQSAPRPEPTVGAAGEGEMFRANPEVARLALRCAARKGNGPAPDLLLTSRRSVRPRERPEDHLDVVGEAIGERLIRVISDVSCEAGFRGDPAQEIEVLNDRHFAEEIRRELAGDLGLPIDSDTFQPFESALAGDFLEWLGANPQAAESMRAKVLGARLYVGCPTFPRHQTR